MLGLPQSTSCIFCMACSSSLEAGHGGRINFTDVCWVAAQGSKSQVFSTAPSKGSEGGKISFNGLGTNCGTEGPAGAANLACAALKAGASSRRRCRAARPRSAPSADCPESARPAPAPAPGSPRICAAESEAARSERPAQKSTKSASPAQLRGSAPCSSWSHSTRPPAQARSSQRTRPAPKRSRSSSSWPPTEPSRRSPRYASSAVPRPMGSSGDWFLSTHRNRPVAPQPSASSATSSVRSGMGSKGLAIGVSSMLPSRAGGAGGRWR
mmetsp:Transcript_63582/g.185930  ORF Transcript_63582/g.185930 Transcript_63582/m.185930 type:complete len:268 (+) Transcript_63582:210-1013(+)